MTIIETVGVSIFCIALVFLVLSVIYFMVIILTKVLGALNSKLTAEVSSDNNSLLDSYTNEVEEENSVAISTGELKLINVDERTAALVMAIVSDETDIPLSELVFKSIKAID